MTFAASNFSNVVSFNFTDSARAAAGLPANGTASGVIIGAHAILTVLHAAQSTENNFTNSTISFGTTKTLNNIFSTLTGGQAQVLAKGYTNGTAYEGNDYAVIAVSADLTKIGTPMALGTPSAGQAVHVTGYPGSAGGTQQDVIVTIGSVDTANNMLTYQNGDITIGSSGGPLWTVNAAGTPTVVGIQSTKDLGASTARFAAAMTADTIANISHWADQANKMFQYGPAQNPAEQNAPGLIAQVQIDDLSASSYVGTANRDKFLASNRATTYDGGAGYDTVVYAPGKHTDYKIGGVTPSASGVTTTVTLPNGAIDQLTNVERLEFSDGVMMFGSASPIQQAVADQLDVVYLGRGMGQGYRDKIAVSLTSGVTAATTASLFYAGIADKAFSASDSLQTIADKTFLNIFGVHASAFEQNAWANTVAIGAVTKEALPWTMFVSYLGATNVPPSYQIPAQSRIVAAHAFSAQVNGGPEAALAAPGAGQGDAARAWLLPIRTQADAALKVVDAAHAVASISGQSAHTAPDLGVFIADVNYGIVGVPGIV